MNSKEQLRQLIRESIENDVRIYVTEGVEVDIYLSSVFNSDDYFTSSSKANISWALDVTHKSYGIKDIFPVIKKIELDLEIWRENKQEYEKVQKVYDNISAADGGEIEGFKLIISKNSESGHIFPQSLSLDEQNKTIDINFDMP